MRGELESLLAQPKVPSTMIMSRTLVPEVPSSAASLADSVLQLSWPLEHVPVCTVRS